jgi:hypothetical protein
MLSDDERRNLLEDEKWWWRMADMLESVEKKGIMAKCRLCLALNPNPQKLTCWQCKGDGITCPSCNTKIFLKYSIAENKWHCPNSNCNKSFTYSSKKADTRYTETNKICPACGKNLYWDEALLLWRCLNNKCKRIYTYEDLNEKPQTEDTEREQVKRKIQSYRVKSRLSVFVVILIAILFIVILWVLLGNQIRGLF